MLIPIGHEHMRARRWPIFTIALIVINLVVFILTITSLERESPELSTVKEHILRLAAMNPELEIADPAREMVDKYQKAHPDEWVFQKRSERPIADAWDLRVRGYMGDGLTQAELQAEMNALVEQYKGLQQDSLLEQYAFVPAHPTPVSYITANFMHGGWLHIIFNMWFLFLAGVVLEDVWGRIVFPIFYLLGGIAALLMHAAMNPASITPCLGASGAVAALMGAFMVRFPKVKIHMFGWVLVRIFRFDAAAIWLLPFWLASEVFTAIVWNGYGGVANWAHVGGFAFGALGAVILKATGIERKLDETIVKKINDKAPETLQAEQLIEEGEFNAAEIALRDVLETNPNSVDALLLLQKVYWRKNDMQQYQEVTLSLSRAYLKARNTDAAWQAYEEFVNGGGKDMHPAVWLDIGRLAEDTQRFERALSEYEKLIATFPNAREALMAQIRAGRICLKQLVQPRKALIFYESAFASPVPHLDLEPTISAGIRECKAALPLAGAVSSRGNL